MRNPVQGPTGARGCWSCYPEEKLRQILSARRRILRCLGQSGRDPAEQFGLPAMIASLRVQALGARSMISRAYESTALHLVFVKKLRKTKSSQVGVSLLARRGTSARLLTNTGLRDGVTWPKGDPVNSPGERNLQKRLS